VNGRRKKEEKLASIEFENQTTLSGNRIPSEENVRGRGRTANCQIVPDVLENWGCIAVMVSAVRYQDHVVLTAEKKWCLIRNITEVAMAWGSMSSMSGG
jgi:hypothetical protein